MKRWILAILMILFMILPLTASKVGLSVGTFDSKESKEGLDIQTGVVVGLSPTLELESQLIVKLTPQPFTNLIGKIGFNYSLLGPVYEKKGTVATYATSYVGLGFMGNLLDKNSYGPFIQITPISVGGSQFRLRERTLTFGLYYNIEKNSFCIYWNLFTLDFFL